MPAFRLPAPARAGTGSWELVMPCRERLLILAALAATGLLGAYATAHAEVVLDQKGRAAARAPAAESGGEQVIPSGDLRLTCMQNGQRIADQEVRNVAVSPLNAVGGLSFDVPGAKGRGLLLPFGDGRTACLLLAKGADLERAGQAFQAAIAEDRPVSWGTVAARASGRVVPGRTFVDAQGRTCREFLQTLLVDGHADRSKGTVCSVDGHGWRLAP